METIAGYSRLGWLGAVLSAQRGRISELLGKLGDLSALRKLNPRLFAKFVNMLGQISAAKAEECETLSKIEAIERRHRFQRKSGNIKHFEADNAPQPLAFEGEDDCEKDCARPDRSWEAFLAQKQAQDAATLPPRVNTIGPPQQSGNALLKLLAAWYLVSLVGNSAKNQDLTAD